MRMAISQPTRLVAKPRSISSLVFSSENPSRRIITSIPRRRWASDDAAGKKEPPISKLQPTSQEEVQNAIAEDNAAHEVDSAPATVGSEAPMAEPASATGGVAQSLAASGTGQATSASQDADEHFSLARTRPKPTIYIGNLFFDVTEDDLKKEMGRFGPIKNLRLIRDARGLSKGFGYITFDTTEQATTAIEAMNQQLYEGRRISVQYASFDGPPASQRPKDKPLNPPSKTLFIGNMSWEMTDRDLNTLFRGIRNVIDVRVAIDRRTGQPRGFAHADFIDIKSAMEAAKALEGKEIYGRKLRIDYSYGSSAASRNQARDENHGNQ